MPAGGVGAPPLPPPLDPLPPPPSVLNHLKTWVLGVFGVTRKLLFHVYSMLIVLRITITQCSLSVYFCPLVLPLPHVKHEDVIDMPLYVTFEDRLTRRKRQEAHHDVQKACSTLFLSVPMAPLCEVVNRTNGIFVFAGYWVHFGRGRSAPSWTCLPPPLPGQVRHWVLDNNVLWCCLVMRCVWNVLLRSSVGECLCCYLPLPVYVPHEMFHLLWRHCRQPTARAHTHRICRVTVVLLPPIPTLPLPMPPYHILCAQ